MHNPYTIQFSGTYMIVA
uniref:Uncharacterized protein n=1 Tax=Arundo donax TaxID=35708 RepID=A0A0A9BCX8_ARUDO